MEIESFLRACRRAHGDARGHGAPRRARADLRHRRRRRRTPGDGGRRGLAARGVLSPGDVIISIDGADMAGMPPRALVQRLRDGAGAARRLVCARRPRAPSRCPRASSGSFSGGGGGVVIAQIKEGSPALAKLAVGDVVVAFMGAPVGADDAAAAKLASACAAAAGGAARSLSSPRRRRRPRAGRRRRRRRRRRAAAAAGEPPEDETKAIAPPPAASARGGGGGGGAAAAAARRPASLSCSRASPSRRSRPTRPSSRCSATASSAASRASATSSAGWS